MASAQEPRSSRSSDRHIADGSEPDAQSYVSVPASMAESMKSSSLP